MKALSVKSIKKDEFITSEHIRCMLDLLNFVMVDDNTEYMFVFLEEENSIDDIIKGKLTFRLKVVEHDTEREDNV